MRSANLRSAEAPAAKTRDCLLDRGGAGCDVAQASCTARTQTGIVDQVVRHARKRIPTGGYLGAPALDVHMTSLRGSAMVRPAAQRADMVG